ncbi:MAG TPA: transporter [Polyangiaceae bacterium]|nr:transporter [Polyangiaceae bacterium]
MSKKIQMGAVGAWCVLGSVGVLAFAESAGAQVVQGDFAVQRYNPAPGPHNMLSARGVRVGDQHSWSVALSANYGNDVFVIDSRDATGAVTEVQVVENQVTNDLMVSYNPLYWMQFGLRMPFGYIEGDGITAAGDPNFADPLEKFSLGDPELEIKARLYGQPNDPFAAGLGLFVRAPVGHAAAKDKFFGDEQPAFGGRLIFDGKHGPLSVLGNLSYTFRDEVKLVEPSNGQTITKIGSELGYNLGVGFAFSPVIRVIAEGFGTTNFTTSNGANSLEAGGGLQITPTRTPLMFSAGGTAGLAQGIGVPVARVMVNIGVYFEPRERDGDGILDADDACPTASEDMDGYEDQDGCPDADNDGDSITDDADKCINDSEDLDGFQDTDGCPEKDNDKDGLDDANDRCPLEQETKNGFRDEDGCPDVPDSDADGVSDKDDKCPEQAEDTDGFDDTDGCPDLDNDQDGVPDAADECVDEAETKNGNADADGCPD